MMEPAATPMCLRAEFMNPLPPEAHALISNFLYKVDMIDLLVAWHKRERRDDIRKVPGGKAEMAEEHKRIKAERAARRGAPRSHSR